MNNKKFTKFIRFLFILLVFLSPLKLSAKMCESDVINSLFLNDVRNFEYNEIRDDSGIHFDFMWDKNNQKIIIKRNQNNYPIIRYSLFNKDLVPGITAIKKIDNLDLSKQDDKQLKKLTYLNGKTDFEIDSGKVFSINSRPYKLNDFKLSNFKILSIQNIDTTKGILELSFDAILTNERNDLKKVLDNQNLMINGLYEICENFYYRNDWPLTSVSFDEFRYDVDVREGLKNKAVLKNPVFEITVDKNLVRTLRTEKGVGFFRQSFDFQKFPFDKQTLLIRIKTNVGNYINNNLDSSNDNIGSLTFLTPEPGVYLNLEKFLDPSINKLKAWKISKDGIKIKNNIISDNSYDIFDEKINFKDENVLDIEINIERNYQHYLFKIMLPVFLILCVAWYVLWIPTEKYEARLNTSIIALLALIAYNFVFQDDIPKLEYLTDIDWFILLSYIFCCIPVFLSIAFSKFISKNQKKVMQINKFIKIWGGVLYLILTLQIFYTN